MEHEEATQRDSGIQFHVPQALLKRTETLRVSSRIRNLLGWTAAVIGFLCGGSATYFYHTHVASAGSAVSTSVAGILLMLLALIAFRQRNARPSNPHNGAIHGE
ncbi:hypothetical protein GF380_00125 [Candidatus Uhrbacteria bacterium]|nr:hypothetical protein [Candidatus Uhrbacteria bacterium]MBD3283831.1 hypothetical protein [Candidatus Uhrbacteria bacterium]